jgi:hypothetical protein
MKKIALALFCIFATGSAAAQTYACQFIMSAGMKKESKTSWRTTSFEVSEPFFLSMSNGSIDTKSMTEAPIGMSPFSVTCMKRKSPTLGMTHWCADYSDYLSFNENTLNGGLAKTFGAMESSTAESSDSVMVSRFKCQKLR